MIPVLDFIDKLVVEKPDYIYKLKREGILKNETYTTFTDLDKNEQAYYKNKKMQYLREKYSTNRSQIDFIKKNVLYSDTNFVNDQAICSAEEFQN